MLDIIVLITINKTVRNIARDSLIQNIKRTSIISNTIIFYLNPILSESDIEYLPGQEVWFP